APVPLEPAQHVRARGEDEVGAGVDERVREPQRVAAALAEVALVHVGDPVRACAHGYGAQPISATSTGPARRYVTWPGRPPYAMPADRSAASVLRRPARPKS